MKIKGKVLFIIGIFIGIVFSILPTKVQAKELASDLYFGIQEYRTGTTPADMAYGINNPEDNGSTVESIVGAKIWDIVRYNSQTDTIYDDSVDFYCAKAGIGFSTVGQKETYNISFDYKTERQAILDTGNSVLESIVNIDNDTYYNIMALADLMYIDRKSTRLNSSHVLTALVCRLLLEKSIC